MFESRNFAGALKLPDRENFKHELQRRPTIWRHMLKKCIERYCHLANKEVEQLCKVSISCSDELQSEQEEPESVG